MKNHQNREILSQNKPPNFQCLMELTLISSKKINRQMNTYWLFFLFRLAALKKNGEENWKKKVPKVEISTSVSRKTSSIIENNAKNINNDNNGNGDHDELSPVTLREKKSSVNRPGGKVGSLQVKLKIFMFIQFSGVNILLQNH